MRVLVLGSGGREHALVWAIAKSEGVEHVYAAPGNPGTAEEAGASNVALDILRPAAVVGFALDNDVDLVVIGPEAPLVAGVADALREAGVRVVGPNADGATLEGSKAFAKLVMDAAGVPTARYANVSSHDAIDAFCDSFDGAALVVKADGLAGGKGVIVCDSVDEARTAAHNMLDQRPFGDASADIVLEERLHGIETSYIVLAAGESYVAFPTSQDHKRLGDGDEGPNTGGMGAYTPAPFVDAATARRIEVEIIEPTLAELARRGIDFRGFLYAGVMLTEAGPRTLEFNVRLGDPETQALLAALDDSLLPALVACADGDVSGVALTARYAAAVIVLAAAGYPLDPEKGAAIEGVGEANAGEGVRVFHAGTDVADGRLVVAGGRVLGVTARADTLDHALQRAYAAAAKIRWKGMHYRRDIGQQRDSVLPAS